MQDAPKTAPFVKILQDYHDWFSQVMRVAFYYDDLGKLDIKTPADLDPQFKDMEHDGRVSAKTTDDVLRHQKELMEKAGMMLSAHKRPDLKIFDDFLETYESFTQRLERFNIDSMLSDFGIDNKTGLRSSTVMIKDLERELERRARRGHPFSIALGHIDKTSPEKYEDQMKLAAIAIRQCARSFDDAYLSSKNEILLCLKQTDNAGAIRFVERLKEVLQDKDADFTMSFCVAEPMPGDDMTVMLAHIRADLRVLANEGGGTGEYEEISPLERFLKGIDK